MIDPAKPFGIDLYAGLGRLGRGSDRRGLGDRKAFGTMAASLKRRSNIAASYDRRVDVLYVTLGGAVPCEGDGRPGGIELDFAIPDGSPCGVTVMGFQRNGWSEKLDRLSGLAADHLKVSIKAVRQAISRALEERTL